LTVSKLKRPLVWTELVRVHVQGPSDLRVLFTNNRTALRYLSEALNVIGTVPEIIAPFMGEEIVVFGGAVRSVSTFCRLSSSPVGEL